MKVLLTGHDGYIGAVMTPMLQESGHEVVGFDSGLFQNCTLGSLSNHLETIHGDIRDAEADDLNGFDAVIHLAAISNDPLGNLNPQCTYDINHRASITLARYAKEAGVERFLYASSCSVYGASDPNDILDETASFHPVTPYAESKVQVEADLSQMADERFSPTYLRNATVYGLSPRFRGDLVVNNLAGWAFTTGQIHLKSDGTPWRPLVHVEDVCQAFLRVLEAPRRVIHDVAFNVGRSDENFRIADVAQIIHEALPDSQITYAEDAGPDPRCYRVDFGKITGTLPQFVPAWTVRRGVQQLLDAFGRLGLQQSDLEGARFQRVKRVMQLLEEGVLDSELRWVAD